MLKILLSLALSGTPHLMIHMDVNRTIVATDPLQGLGVEEIVNLSLAKKFAWRWDPSLEEPMSYFDYVYGIKYPGERRDKALREKRRSDIGSFIEQLKEKEHPLYPEALKTLAQAQETLQGRYLFPAFLKLIQVLETQNRAYSLIFRTFGKDLDHVEAALGMTIPRVQFAEGKLLTPEGTLSDPTEIFAYLKGHKVLGIRDDYTYWNTHNEHKAFGKQFPLELGGHTTSIFFDDNIESDPLINIVAPYDIHTDQPLEILPLIDQGILVPVVTIDAILDEDYFLKHL